MGFKLDENTVDVNSKEQESPDDKEKAVEEEVKVASKKISSQIEITPAVADPSKNVFFYRNTCSCN